jgi:phosphate/sulfate permease
MNEENNIEDLFRDKFKNYSPPPPDGLWDKIETKIGAENKKAGFWIFSNFWGKIFSSLFIIAFISAFSAAYFMSKPKVYSNSKKESKIKENVSESSFNLTANENKIFQENKSQK